ncbi:MAG: alpha/beta fold hydrolase [Actinomycetota bacterium]
MSTPPHLQLPARARRLEIPVTRGSRAAVEIAPDDPEGTAVLIPGFTGSKEDFIALLEPLAGHGWRVVAYDQLGQWESIGPDNDDAYRLAALGADAGDVAAWAATTSGHAVHLVGHSLGGLVARSAIVDAGATTVDAVTLLCSGPGALPAHRHGTIPALVAVLPDMLLADIWVAKEAMDRDAGWEPPSPEVYDFLRARFCAVNPWSLREMGRILLDEPDRTDLLAAADVITHVVYGEHDDAWPTEEQDAMAAALGVVPRVIPGAGHSPAVDDPATTAALLDRMWRDCRARRDSRD